MSGAAAGSRAADVLHKTVTTGLVLVTIAGLADVVRGFTVLTKRNIDRRSAPSTSDVSTSSTTSSSSDE